jgi:hypothetical protein
MDDTRGYRIGIVLFGIAAGLSAAAALYGSYCCAGFPTDVQALRTNFGTPERRAMPWLTATLMDWPLGYRLIVMTLASSLIGVVISISAMTLASWKAGAYARLWAVFSMLSASFLVGVLYILTIYVAGYFGYRGPLSLVAWIGISVGVGLMYAPNRSGLILAVPLTPAGFIVAGVTSMIVGIPWD